MQRLKLENNETNEPNTLFYYWHWDDSGDLLNLLDCYWQPGVDYIPGLPDDKESIAHIKEYTTRAIQVKIVFEIVTQWFPDKLSALLKTLNDSFENYQRQNIHLFILLSNEDKTTENKDNFTVQPAEITSFENLKVTYPFVKGFAFLGNKDKNGNYISHYEWLAHRMVFLKFIRATPLTYLQDNYLFSHPVVFRFYAFSPPFESELSKIQNRYLQAAMKSETDEDSSNQWKSEAVTALKGSIGNLHSKIQRELPKLEILSSNQLDLLIDNYDQFNSNSLTRLKTSLDSYRTYWNKWNPLDDQEITGNLDTLYHRTASWTDIKSYLVHLLGAIKEEKIEYKTALESSGVLEHPEEPFNSLQPINQQAGKLFEQYSNETAPWRARYEHRIRNFIITLLPPFIYLFLMWWIPFIPVWNHLYWGIGYLFLAGYSYYRYLYEPKVRLSQLYSNLLVECRKLDQELFNKAYSTAIHKLITLLESTYREKQNKLENGINFLFGELASISALSYDPSLYNGALHYIPLDSNIPITKEDEIKIQNQITSVIKEYIHDGDNSQLLKFAQKALTEQRGSFQEAFNHLKQFWGMEYADITVIIDGLFTSSHFNSESGFLLPDGISAYSSKHFISSSPNSEQSLNITNREMFPAEYETDIIMGTWGFIDIESSRNTPSASINDTSHAAEQTSSSPTESQPDNAGEQ
jgi:hypothetical protein